MKVYIGKKMIVWYLNDSTRTAHMTKGRLYYYYKKKIFEFIFFLIFYLLWLLKKKRKRPWLNGYKEKL